MADPVGDLGADFGGGSIGLTVSLPLALTRNHIGDISRM